MKLRKVIALVLAALLLCGAMMCTASADAEYRAKQVERFEEMKNRTIDVRICSGGGYAVKSTKFYVREVTGVDGNGDFILGSWRCLDSDTNLPMFTHEFKAPGTCVAFAYSCDIIWGTDFPYSGVFWNDPTRDVNSIMISLTGLVRAVEVTILVDDEVIYSCSNSDSHDEWKP